MNNKHLKISKTQLVKTFSEKHYKSCIWNITQIFLMIRHLKSPTKTKSMSSERIFYLFLLNLKSIHFIAKYINKIINIIILLKSRTYDNWFLWCSLVLFLEFRHKIIFGQWSEPLINEINLFISDSFTKMEA